MLARPGQLEQRTGAAGVGKQGEADRGPESCEHKPGTRLLSQYQN